jgi:Protein SCAI
MVVESIQVPESNCGKVQCISFLFQETSFKEWKQIVHEFRRFLKAEKEFENSRSLRFNLSLDSHPNSIELIAPFYSKRVLRLRDAVLTSYHRNEVLILMLILLCNIM